MPFSGLTEAELQVLFQARERIDYALVLMAKAHGYIDQVVSYGSTSRGALPRSDEDWYYSQPAKADDSPYRVLWERPRYGCCDSD